MNLKSLTGAVCLALTFGLSAPASGAPIAPAPSAAVTHSDMLQLVRGCHRSEQRHYVPEVRGTIRHSHRGRDCRPIAETRRDRGRDRARGRGRGPDRARDCHRNVERHYLRQYRGSVVHRHVGRSCRVAPLRRTDRGGRDCLSFGPVRFCER